MLDRDVLLTIAGVVSIFALIGFFLIEMTNPGEYVLADRTIYIMLSLIAALLGFNQVLDGTISTSDRRPDDRHEPDPDPEPDRNEDRYP